MSNKIDEALKALNVMDDFAIVATRDNDNGEAEQLAEAYRTLYSFITNSGR